MIIKFINCTEKHHKELDEVIGFLNNYIVSNGIKTDEIKMSAVQITTCTECRCCTQKKGEIPVKCIFKDEMNDVLDLLENCDGYVILADRNNLFSKNQVHEKFSQRLIGYQYWPYGQERAIPRKKLEKSSILINYNTTKYIANHTFYTSKKYMEYTSNSLGAKVLDWEAITPQKDLLEVYKDRFIKMANLLIKEVRQKAKLEA